MDNIKAKFVSQKISKTRWRPEPASSLQQPDLFAAGSWDNEENKVSIWSTGEFGTITMDEDYLADIKLLCEIRHKGDVTDLQFLDQERIVTASSTGKVTSFVTIRQMRHYQKNRSGNTLIKMLTQMAQEHRALVLFATVQKLCLLERMAE